MPAMMIERQTLSGILHIVVRDADGRVIEERRVKNLITLGGKLLLANLLAGKAELPTSWQIAVGTGTDDPKPEDKKLGQEVEAVTAGVVVEDGTLKATAVATFPTRDPSAPVQALTEAGIKMSRATQEASAATLFNRVSFKPVNRAPSMQMTLHWEIQF